MRETLTMPKSLGVVTVYEAVPPGKVPRLVKKVTEVPMATAFPAASLSVAVIVVELAPSAGMSPGLALSVIEAVGPGGVSGVVVVVVVVVPVVVVPSSSLKQAVRVRPKAIIRRASNAFKGKALFFVLISLISLKNCA
jgi:hypothetical protein